jgi:protein TonB
VETSTQPVHRGFAASAALHVAAVMALMMLARGGDHARHAILQSPSGILPNIIWFSEPGLAGGGGGGGSRSLDPPRRAERPGADARTVPAAKPESASPTASDRDPTAQLDIPAQSLASSIVLVAGSIDALTDLSTDSRGSGRGPGSGSGDGSGDGPGRGSGRGDGLDRNAGGGVYRPGSGVTTPIEIRRGIPKYTADAMRARLQGVVLVECVVEVSGRCSRTRVVRGLEPSFGLNDEAIRAAEEWRFRPGTSGGQPVPVVVTMEITFVLR